LFKYGELRSLSLYIYVTSRMSCLQKIKNPWFLIYGYFYTNFSPLETLIF
jgi:hypothetical protein